MRLSRRMGWSYTASGRFDSVQACAREVARMHGTPIFVWEDGKVVAKKP